ncbi:hypothetical protein BUALT_Bualt02G0083700 [Buddleja alternifolia]|uniref:POT1A/B-like OB fold domain-containing protein n=1 Tax=Buddleja alternifolia TaxID=168488 RepID=A0AAV6Y5J0_9LAMI|nr:hypothetical protein BUALT_Bualt02G0083700 [Buddleja alternifolia]
MQWEEAPESEPLVSDDGSAPKPLRVYLPALTEETLLGLFMHGLREEVQVQVLVFDPVDLDAAMKMSLNIEVALRVQQRGSGVGRAIGNLRATRLSFRLEFDVVNVLQCDVEFGQAEPGMTISRHPPFFTVREALIPTAANVTTKLLIWKAPMLHFACANAFLEGEHLTITKFDASVKLLEDEMKNPLPLQLESDPLSRDILCTFPSVGTVLRMIVDRGNEKLGINFLNTNRWVKFVNVKIEVRDALWLAVLMPFSKLCYLRDDDDRVIERQRSYNERVSSKWGRMPFTSFPWASHITETEHPDVPFVTLMNVLTHPEVTKPVALQVTCKFKCVVRVVAVYPWRAEDFRSPNGVYRVRLTLEDPTARIHAFLYAEDGMNFFGDSHSADVLTKKRNMLLGLVEDGAKRNPPWIQCCLKSYYIDKNDVWESRNYRIFSTTFVG